LGDQQLKIFQLCLRRTLHHFHFKSAFTKLICSKAINKMFIAFFILHFARLVMNRSSTSK
jgi:hypothetical protein